MQQAGAYVPGAVAGIGRADPIDLVARVQGRLDAVLQGGLRASRPGRRANIAGVVALAVVAHGAAQYLVDGQAQGLALDVPQRQVEGAHGVLLLPARRVEPRHVFFLPDGFDLERVLADEGAGALLQRVLGAALADAGDAGFGLHRHQHVALVEKLVEIGRLVNADPRDPGFRQGGFGEPREGQAGGGRGRERLQKRSSLHG